MVRTTTNSVVAVFRDGEVEVLENELGETLTPSVVARDPRDGAVVVGRVARELRGGDPALGAVGFKRDMGSERTHGVGGEDKWAVWLSHGSQGISLVDNVIYGAEYTLPENLPRLRSRAVRAKRSLALREYALGLEALHRFVEGEHPWLHRQDAGDRDAFPLPEAEHVDRSPYQVGDPHGGDRPGHLAAERDAPVAGYG